MKRKKLLLIFLLLPFICLADPTTELAHPNSVQIWIAFLPVIFFTIIIISIVLKLRRDKSKISDLIAEKDKIPVGATTGGAQNNEAPSDNPPQSASRFIALVCGLTTIAIAVCLTTFYMYECFDNKGKDIDLSKLTTVLLTLGIGVLPYGFNKASAAFKSN